MARHLIELTAPGITRATTKVGFFDKEGAWQLIQAYAATAAKPGSQYQQHPELARDLIAAYFDAIENVLGLGAGELWQNEQGRVLVGYAPVLAAVGSILAEIDDFSTVANNLKSYGGREAWGVIEAVLYEILGREQAKLRELLSAQCKSALPHDVYDAEEQMALLAQYVEFEAPRGDGPGRAPAGRHGKIQRHGPNVSAAPSVHTPARIWQRRTRFACSGARRLSRQIDLSRSPGKPVATMASVSTNA